MTLLPQKKRFLSHVSLFFIPTVTLLLYIHTQTPAVGLIDSGELAAGCFLLNILHPTGYPLYTLIGRIFSLLPVLNVSSRLVFMSIIFATGGILIFGLICRKERINSVLSGTVAALLTVSPVLWSVSVDVEVYTLTFLLSCLIWMLSYWKDNARYLPAISYFAGLTVTNHLTGLWTVIGMIITLILTWRRRLRSYLVPMVLFFFLGVSPYLYLILRARAQPLLAWGNPVDLKRFWWHITGRQYQVWMFTSSLRHVVDNFLFGLKLITHTFGYLLLPVVLYGMMQLIRQKRPLAIGLIVTTMLTLLYAANYAIPDITGYYLPAVVALSVFAAAGLNGIYHRWGKISYLATIIPLMLLIVNYPVYNQNQNWVAYDQALNTLRSADSGAIIITDWWDVYAPIFYLHEVEKIRPDISIIDKELLRRSWYFSYLEKRYPALVNNCRAELNQFLSLLYRFENGLPYDPVTIQASYIQLLRSFFLNNPSRPVYITFAGNSTRDARELVNGWQTVPVGILFQLRTDTLIPHFDYYQLRVRIPRYGLNERTRLNLERYRLFVEERIRLLNSRKRLLEARKVNNWYQEHFRNFR